MRNLSKTESYISSKKDVKAFLGHYEMLTVNFGMRRKFEFDSRCSNKPKVAGPVVVSVSINRSREAMVSFYPVSLSDLPVDAVKEFHGNTLLAISKWIEKTVAKPEMAIVGVEQLIVALEEEQIIFHQTVFL